MLLASPYGMKSTSKPDCPDKLDVKTVGSPLDCLASYDVTHQHVLLMQYILQWQTRLPSGTAMVVAAQSGVTTYVLQ